MLTAALDLLAAFLIVSNLRTGWWLVALLVGALLAVIVALGSAAVDLVPAVTALRDASIATHGVFCALCAWLIRAFSERA